MRSTRLEDAQSFLLRFWYEASQLEPSHWRGTIWHQQRGQEEVHRPVAGPEEAFEAVRCALAHVTPGAPQREAGPGRNASVWMGFTKLLRRVVGQSR
jgi:hypothetical protein